MRSFGSLNVAGALQVQGSSSFFNTIEVVSSVSASTYYGDGSNLTGIIHYTDDDTKDLMNLEGVVSTSTQISNYGFISESLINNVNIDASATTVSTTFGPTSSVVIDHNLGSENILVSVYDTDNYLVSPNYIQIQDENSVKIDFYTNEVEGKVVIVQGGHVLNAISGSQITNNTDNYVITATNYGFNGESNLTFDGSTLNVTGDTCTNKLYIRSNEYNIENSPNLNYGWLRYNTKGCHYFYATGSAVAYINKDGMTFTSGKEIWVDTINGTNWNDFSALKYKENIQDVSSQCSLGIMDMRVVTFDWKEETRWTGSDIGFIADEVYQIFPDVVNLKDGEIDGLDYNKITPLLVRYVQTLTDTVNQLNNRISILESGSI
jgi:hypothetical protein